VGKLGEFCDVFCGYQVGGIEDVIAGGAGELGGLWPVVAAVEGPGAKRGVDPLDGRGRVAPILVAPLVAPAELVEVCPAGTDWCGSSR